jgi:diguanylate cyclase (GGDEF)-like protein
MRSEVKPAEPAADTSECAQSPRSTAVHQTPVARAVALAELSDGGGPITSESPAASSQADARGSSRRWVIVACAVILIGLGGSLAAALLWRSSVNARNSQNFQTSAANVSGTLEQLIRRDTDFVRSVRAVLTLQPDITASGFKRWATQLEDHQSQLGTLGALIVRSVPAAQLAKFEAQRDGDPAFRALVGGHIEHVFPSGRSRYCLLSGGSALIGESSEVALTLEGDWCDPTSLIGGYRQNGTTRAQFTKVITENGEFAAYSATTAGITTLILESAVYKQGVPLTTAAEREADVRGWVLGSFDIGTLLSSSLHAEHGLAVTLYHQDVGQTKPEYIGRAGATSDKNPLTHNSTLDVDGRWTVKVAGAPISTGPSANVQALVVFLAGLIGTLLLSALVLVLARSRERALGIVREKTTQLRHQALHDALTGLPNRVLALDRAEQMLARARRQQLPVAALYLDIDGFKDVNDTFGHAAGDQLLRLVAARLQSVIREGDTAARLAGDEFVVLVEGSTLDAGPELVAERVLEVLREPYDMRSEIGRELALTASVGIAYGARDSAEQLLRDADVALYEAKTAGRDRYMLFRAAMQTAIQDRMAIQLDLAGALEREQLFLLYQPTFDLQSERVIGVEALIRWRHPTRGTLPPSEFIPIAEATGLIVPIGRWVLRHACIQAASWRAQGHTLGISVNVSARQLDGEELIADVRDALHESELDPAALTLEITEAALMRDPEQSAERMRLLKELGVRIAIDDFGTGYSSLAHLRQFPADALKIDRTFISGLASSKQSAALIQTLVQLGKTLEIETLAEGIEEQVQLQSLQRERCDSGQGFLFSRPLDVAAIEVFLNADGAPAPPQPTR